MLRMTLSLVEHSVTTFTEYEGGLATDKGHLRNSFQLAGDTPQQTGHFVAWKRGARIAVLIIIDETPEAAHQLSESGGSVGSLLGRSRQKRQLGVRCLLQVEPPKEEFQQC
ncbi:hypothetical protein CY652_10610 [Burkholderia sp. WAC0059]|nr:hypothetical protein CY652_10610 [Burkholderia sp. WAC0059]